MSQAPQPVAIVLIAALDRHFAIGRGNALPWSLPEDLRHFKALTMGHTLLMGRKTAESLGRALPGRRNLVLTRSAAACYPGMEPVASLDAALACVAPPSGQERPTLMVIGGGEVYALALPRAARMHLTHVDTVIEAADAWFPRFDPGDWVEIPGPRHPADRRHAHGFRFVEYRRRTG